MPTVLRGSDNFETENVGTAVDRDAIGSGDLYSRGGILGTVSQSGGVPTGAIIERGSNADGEYVKFADGTMICTDEKIGIVVNTPHGGIFRSNSLKWDYPATFIDEPAGAGKGKSGYGYEWVGASALADSSNERMEYSVFRAVESANSIEVKLMAIGRWF